MLLYGFPPGVGATGTAALLNVPKSLERLLAMLRQVRWRGGAVCVGGRGRRGVCGSGAWGKQQYGSRALEKQYSTTAPGIGQDCLTKPLPPMLLLPPSQEGYDLGPAAADLEGAGEAIVTALKLQEDQRAIAGAGGGAEGCLALRWAAGVRRLRLRTCLSASDAPRSPPAHSPPGLPRRGRRGRGAAWRGPRRGFWRGGDGGRH